ncbi:ABC transporter substrate-binding protein [Thermodesulfobacteriota bacterium]
MNKIIPPILLLFMLAFSATVAAANPGPVVVLLSDDEAAYSLPVETFRVAVKAPIRVFNLGGDVDRASAVMSEILDLDPSLLFTLGAKASYVAKVWTSERPDLPVLFAMVLNWQRYQLTQGQANVFGIDSSVEPGVLFAHMLMLSPTIKRIGVIYNADLSSEMVVAARDAAEVFGVELVEQTVSRSSDLKRAYLEIGDRIDGLLILADPVVYTLENVAWLQKRCMRDQLICVGQSENVAKTGILMAIDPDVPNLGAQAASMARSVLSGHQSPGNIGVMPPLGTRLYLNLRTAHRIGLHPSRAAINLASEVFDEQ